MRDLALVCTVVYRETVATYSEILKVENPSLETVKHHREANTFSLLIVALIEHGGPMTLDEVAARFEAAGIAPADEALYSLRRCRPARPPIYREGNMYCLDPHDSSADLWTFRLDMRPPKVAHVDPVRPALPPLPGPDVRLSIAELDEAWKDAGLSSISARKLVLAVLDAHGGPMTPEDVVAALRARTQWHWLSPDSAKFKQRGSPVVVDSEGRWAIAPGSDDALHAARSMVRERLTLVRNYAPPDPVQVAAIERTREERREAHRAERSRLRHAIVHGFPPTKPEALALLDVHAHTVDNFVGDELEDAKRRLGNFDVIAGIDVWPLFRSLGIDPTHLHLVDLGPPQKTKQLNRSGRTLKITTELLIQGTCGISRPFAPASLRKYLAAGDETRLRRRLESEVKSLHALYQYGTLHGALRLRWGFLDERLPAPWGHRDDLLLSDLMRQALARDVALQVVIGSAPGWADPWSRAFTAHIVRGDREWDLYLVDDLGLAVRESEVRLARILETREA